MLNNNGHSDEVLKTETLIHVTNVNVILYSNFTFGGIWYYLKFTYAL